jgi:hypothetical protein
LFNEHKGKTFDYRYANGEERGVPVHEMHQHHM